MKRTTLLILLIFCITLLSQAQTGFKWQGVAKDSLGNPITLPVTLTFSIFQNTDTVYVETHNPIIPNGGQLTAIVGTGTAVQDTFSNIDWSSGFYSLNVKMQIASGTVVDMGTSQILPVPIAAYSKIAGSSLDWENVGDTLLQTTKHAEILKNLYVGSWNEHFLDLQHDRKRITIPADPDGAMVFYTHSDQSNPRWEFRDLKTEDLIAQFNTVGGDAWFRRNLLINSWGEHMLDLQHDRKRITIPADPDGRMIFYTHSDQTNPRWDFRDLKTENLFFQIDQIEGVWCRSHLSTQILEIRGGSDITEKVNSNEILQPGEVIVTDPTNPNHVLRSSKAYDRTVLGVVSGAGGISSGMELKQEGLLDGNTSFAIAGRVYVKVTGKVEPGDLLATSDVAGHAMKAKSRRKSHGAIIGKALSFPDKDGLVLMIVNLQ